MRVLKTMNYRSTEAQRKAREEKTISGFLVFDFLCVSMVDGFWFSWFATGFQD
jgi:hypothetical protein